MNCTICSKHKQPPYLNVQKPPWEHDHDQAIGSGSLYASSPSVHKVALHPLVTKTITSGHPGAHFLGVAFNPRSAGPFRSFTTPSYTYTSPWCRFHLNTRGTHYSLLTLTVAVILHLCFRVNILSMCHVTHS